MRLRASGGESAESGEEVGGWGTHQTHPPYFPLPLPVSQAEGRRYSRYIDGAAWSFERSSPVAKAVIA